MKYLYLLSLVICLVSCKTKSHLKSVNSKEINSTTCPKNGFCSFKLYENKILKVKTDDFGAVYTEILDGDYLVLKFEYNKNDNPNYQDGSYREEVFIQLDPKNLELETTNLKDEKLFFARWCYCKGQTGYYKINQGKLSVVKTDDKSFKVNLSFKITEVPQIINEINQTFNLQ